MADALRSPPTAAGLFAGRRLLVTRPAPQAAGWVAELRASGVDAEALPLIEIVPPADGAAVAAAWDSLSRRRLLVFVSPSAVGRFFDAQPARVAWPPLTVAAPGSGTRAALIARGVAPGSIIEPAADAPEFDSESLWLQLGRHSWRDASVLIVRGDGGRDWLAERFRAEGALVDFVCAYHRRAAGLQAASRRLLLGALAQPAGHAWLFSSSEAIAYLAQVSAIQGDALRQQLGPATALATHPRIAERARAAGFGRVVATRPTLAAVVACLQSLAAVESLST